MLKLLWIAPIALFSAGCSHSTPAGDARPAASTGVSRVVEAAAAPASEPMEAERSTAVIPRGTRLTVRINESLDTRITKPGERFTAVLTQPVSVDGGTVLPTGTTFSGRVTTSADSGRMKGRAVIAVTLDSFRLRGGQHPIDTNSVQRVSSAHKNRNVALIGGGAGLGAAIGAIAGGGKGAAIGAVAGAGAGTAGAAATGKKHVQITAETLLTFRLAAPVRF